MRRWTRRCIQYITIRFNSLIRYNHVILQVQHASWWVPILQVVFVPCEHKIDARIAECKSREKGKRAGVLMLILTDSDGVRFHAVFVWDLAVNLDIRGNTLGLFLYFRLRFMDLVIALVF